MKKILCALAGLLLFSCQNTEDPANGAQGYVDVVFSVALPEQVETPTKAPYSDTDIDNIDLLVFDQANMFLERIKVNTVSGTGSTKTFTARLDASLQARTIHIVANARNLTTDADRIDFSYVTLNKPESEAIPSLISNPMTTPSEAEIMPLIMWGRITLPSIASNTTPYDVKLLRSQACLQVLKGTPDATNGLADFEITSATIHAAAATGRVAPAAYTVPASIPTTPTEVASPPTRINYYASGYIVTGQTPIMYMYERNNISSDYAAVIIEGKWKGTSGYYKVILKDNFDNILNIVRNHRYIVTVIKALGAGYATRQEAINNQASNIQVSITDERGELHFIQTDGTGELGVSINMLKLWGTAAGNIDIANVFATRYSQLSVSSSNIPGLSGLNFPAGTENRVLKGNWTGNTVQSGTITITDGLLNHTINVIIEPALSSMFASSDADSYCHNLFTAVNMPWFAEIERGSENVRLHPSISTSSSYSGSTDFGNSYLENKYTDNAFLHVMNTGGLAIVKVSYIEAGSLTVGKIVINR